MHGKFVQVLRLHPAILIACIRVLPLLNSRYAGSAAVPGDPDLPARGAGRRHAAVRRSRAGRCGAVSFEIYRNNMKLSLSALPARGAGQRRAVVRGPHAGR